MADGGNHPEFTRCPGVRFKVHEVNNPEPTAENVKAALACLGQDEKLYLYHPYLAGFKDQVYSLVESVADLERLIRLHGRKEGKLKLVTLLWLNIKIDRVEPKRDVIPTS